jgi:hypothetical protein
VVASPSPGAALAREHQSYMKQLARSLREQLAASVACPLCSELLLDAVVCPCSHSFCWVCLEDFHRSRGLTVASCPVCVRSRPQAAHPDSDGSLLASTGDGHENIDGVGAGAGVAQYFRCAALDGLVGALLDMEGEEEGEAAREVRNVHICMPMYMHLCANIHPTPHMCESLLSLSRPSGPGSVLPGPGWRPGE